MSPETGSPKSQPGAFSPQEHREGWAGVWAGPAVLLELGALHVWACQSPWGPSKFRPQPPGRDDIEGPLLSPALLSADPDSQHTAVL